jgi:hypothetical protein
MIMKTSTATAIGLAASLFLIGCAHSHEGTTAMDFEMGPMVSSDGVTNYPAKPGATYDNVPVDYTTNPPPAGVADGVTVTTTNGIIHIRSIDGGAFPK